jgi:hypothetical protein
MSECQCDSESAPVAPGGKEKKKGVDIVSVTAWQCGSEEKNEGQRQESG